MKALFCILLGFCLANAYRKGKRPDRIMGSSTVAYIHDYPFFVQLKLIYSKTVLSNKSIEIEFDECGGTLIHPKYVLTAGHCFHTLRRYNMNKLQKENYLEVYAGTKKKFSGGVLNWIKKIRIHPNYYEKLDFHGYVVKLKNDIAVARLKNSFNLTRNINLAYVPPLGSEKLCETGKILGIGRTGVNKGDEAEYVMYGVKATPKERKDLKTNLNRPMLDTVFYTEIKWNNREIWEGGIVMKGDSGGPFVCSAGDQKNIVVGVASVGSTKLEPNSLYVNVFEQVSKHVGFIKALLPGVNTLAPK